LEELTSDIDVCSCRIHGATSDEAAFDELVRVTTHDFTVFAGAWFTFVSVDDVTTWSEMVILSESVLEG
jgi:hypothetical protein